MQSVQRTPEVTSGAKIAQEWHVLTGNHTVLPASRTFIHEWNEPTCIHLHGLHVTSQRCQSTDGNTELMFTPGNEAESLGSASIAMSYQCITSSKKTHRTRPS